MQQNQPRHRQLQLTVLRPRTQHPEEDAQRALQLQVPLVLLCAMRGVPSHRMGQCVQVACESLLAFAHAGTKTVSLSRRPPMWDCSVPYEFPGESAYTTFALVPSIIGDLFSLRHCYSDNAKSELKEVNHFIHPALVCLDLPLSAMKKAKTPFIF